MHACPSRSADTETGAGDVCGNLTLLKRVELLELLEAKRKNVVIERLGSSVEKPLQRRLVACAVAHINCDRATHLPSGFAFDAKPGIARNEVQPPAMHSTFQGFVSPRASAFFKPEQH